MQSDEVCAKAEEMLKKNNVPEDQISAVEESLQSSATALTNILLLVGGVVGAQVGTRIGVYLKAEQLRILLAAMVLLVCGKLAFDLLVEPAELYSLGSGGH